MIKIDNVDFLIPIKETKQKEQIQSLDIVAPFIEYYFQTNRYIKKYAKGGVCNKAKMLNELYKWSKTRTNSPVLCLHDADVILKPFQYLTAIKLIIDGEADIVIPHNGYIYDLLKEFHSKIEKDPSFIFEITKQMVVRSSSRNFGGVLFIKRTVFKQIGMANENLLFTHKVNSELLERAMKLGMKIKSVSGPIIHFPHKDTRLVGVPLDSRELITINNYRERFRINIMTSRELRNYIKFWAWTKEGK